MMVEDVVWLHLGLYDIAWPSYDMVEVVRLLYDHRSTVIRFPYDITDMTDASQTHRFQCDHKTKILIS